MNTDITIGMDMGDKSHRICVINKEGEIVAMEGVCNTAEAIREHFKAYHPCLIAIEAGTHSGWVSRLLQDLGHEVLVGNPRKLRAIWDTDAKDDDRDAEMLARIARFDRRLLHPILHRGVDAHSDLAVVKSRDMLVRSRSRLIAYVRCTVKSSGHRLADCSPESFHRKVVSDIPEEIKGALLPVIAIIEQITEQICGCDKRVDVLCKEKYPETDGIRQIGGVGPITSLAYILTIEDKSRFRKSRTAGAFLGLTTKRDKSGETDKQLHITKAGNVYLRRLLVGSAQYVLGPFGPDCDLRRFGEKIAQRGGKNAKRRAVVAVARKLAVLMHHLWKTGESYDPFYQKNHKKRKAA